MAIVPGQLQVLLKPGGGAFAGPVKFLYTSYKVLQGRPKNAKKHGGYYNDTKIPPKTKPEPRPAPLEF